MHFPATLTPAQFEAHVRDWLATAGAGLRDLEVTRLETVGGDGGTYEMDVVARFSAFGGAEFVVIVECKHHRDSIKREVIQVLEAKLRDTKANKGIVAATSRFQSGALDFAAAHGIATLLVSDAGVQYQTRSRRTGPPPSTPGLAIAWLCSPSEGGIQLSCVHPVKDDPLRAWLQG